MPRKVLNSPPCVPVVPALQVAAALQISALVEPPVTTSLPHASSHVPDASNFWTRLFPHVQHVDLAGVRGDRAREAHLAPEPAGLRELAICRDGADLISRPAVVATSSPQALMKFPFESNFWTLLLLASAT